MVYIKTSVRIHGPPAGRRQKTSADLLKIFRRDVYGIINMYILQFKQCRESIQQSIFNILLVDASRMKYKMTKSSTYTCTRCHLSIMGFAIHACGHVPVRLEFIVGNSMAVVCDGRRRCLHSCMCMVAVYRRTASWSPRRRSSQPPSIYSVRHRRHITHSPIGRARPNVVAINEVTDSN